MADPVYDPDKFLDMPHQLWEAWGNKRDKARLRTAKLNPDAERLWTQLLAKASSPSQLEQRFREIDPETLSPELRAEYEALKKKLDG